MNRANFFFIAIVFSQIIFAQNDKSVDDFLWLEDLESKRSQSWVQTQNNVTVAEFAQGKRFNKSKKTILNQLNGNQRVDFLYHLGKDLFRVKKYSPNSNGILESITFEESKKKPTMWRQLIDFDELSKVENQSVTMGEKPKCLPANPNICLIGISIKGSDKHEYREFNINDAEFVEDGFVIPAGDTYISWFDENTILFSSTFDNLNLSKAGYSRTVRKWRRGTRINSAEVILEKKSGDGLLPVQYVSEGELIPLIQHWHDFYNGDVYQFSGDDIQQVMIPTSHEIYGVHKNKLMVKNYQKWVVQGEEIKKGTLIAVDLMNSKNGEALVERVFSPAQNQSFEKIYLTSNRVLIMILEDMITKTIAFEREEADKNWSKLNITPPANDVVRILSTNDLSEEAIVIYRGFLNPTRLYFMNPASNSHRLWEKSSESFDPEGLKFDYAFATSEDGVRIPYQIVGPENYEPNKTYPTIIYVYGAYGVPGTAWYRADLGTEWLKQGGIFVIANARGGGAYGEDWHQAAIRLTKHKTVDDVATVAKELIRSEITESGKIGVIGASSGGTTACSVLVRYPELINAAVCKAALTDLLRFTELFKGAAWIPEYGDPRVKEEAKYLLVNSPFHLVTSDSNLPAPLLISFANDDRVHPGHGRKFVAKMQALGMEAFLYESPEGGHGGATTIQEKANIRAIEYEYFKKRLFNE